MGFSHTKSPGKATGTLALRFSESLGEVPSALQAGAGFPCAWASEALASSPQHTAAILHKPQQADCPPQASDPGAAGLKQGPSLPSPVS